MPLVGVCVCVCVTQTDGHLGPGSAPTALAATSYTEQGAARDQPRTCTHHPPAADSRGVRREEAAGQYTRPRGDELGSGDVDGAVATLHVEYTGKWVLNSEFIRFGGENEYKVNSS